MGLWQTSLGWKRESWARRPATDLLLRTNDKRGLHEFDIVIFNFPYVKEDPRPEWKPAGTLPTSCKSAALIVDFLVFCSQEAKIGAEILLGLATSKSMTFFDDQNTDSDNEHEEFPECYRPDQYGKYAQFSAESLVSQVLAGNYAALYETDRLLPVLLLEDKDKDYYSMYENEPVAYEHVAESNNKTHAEHSVARHLEVQQQNAFSFHFATMLSQQSFLLYSISPILRAIDQITYWIKFRADTAPSVGNAELLFDECHQALVDWANRSELDSGLAVALSAGANFYAGFYSKDLQKKCGVSDLLRKERRLAERACGSNLVINATLEFDTCNGGFCVSKWC
ncbi:unnamed protein product [Amoebophrya sp. A120]|nr:unnamed protein product [Amoebophrya sp. A120]|eukprot:GSA120T00016911001.1